MTLSTIERVLAAADPFKHLSVTERKRVAEAARERRYAKGETLFRAGQPSDAVWVVKTGRVHLMRFLSNGKASTTCVMSPGELFCCLPALDRKTYPTDAIAALDSVVIRIPADAFHEVMNHSSLFTQRTLCVFCDRLRQIEHASCMVYEPVDQRLAQVLLTLAKKFGTTIPLTRQELSEIAGTTHETAIRVLSRFRQRGFIRSVRGKTTILSTEKLQRVLDHP